MKLYQFLGTGIGNQIQVAANYTEQNIQVEYIKGLQDLKTPTYLKSNPFGKAPLLETPEGPIYESKAILRYMARQNKEKKLLGASDFEESQVNQWLDFSSTQLEPPLNCLKYTVLGYMQFDESRKKKAFSDLQQAIRLMEAHLKKQGNFLVGSQVTLADIAIVSQLIAPFKFFLDEKFRKSLPSVTKWFMSIAEQKEFQNIFGRVILCQQEFQVPQCSQPPAGEKKANEQKKEEPKKKKKEEEEEELDDEKIMAKAKNPLDLLPETKFNLYDFKTLIVNAKDKAECVKFFWDNYEPEGWSCWFIKYDKLEGDCEKLWLTQNLKEDLLQRLDKFRKYSFGAHGIYGEEGKYDIKGAWFWRGTEIPQEIKDLVTFDIYFWNKLDVNNPEQKKLWSDYLTNIKEGDVVDGQKVVDVKYFR